MIGKRDQFNKEHIEERECVLSDPCDGFCGVRNMLASYLTQLKYEQGTGDAPDDTLRSIDIGVCNHVSICSLEHC